jgi:hypothetical protein
MDAYAKTVLTVIAACLALQVAQGFGLAGTPGPAQASASSGETPDRFQMLPIPMARQVFRFDRATGQTWTMTLQLEEKHFWTPVPETPPEPKARKKAPPQPKKKADGAAK